MNVVFTVNQKKRHAAEAEETIWLMRVQNVSSNTPRKNGFGKPTHVRELEKKRRKLSGTRMQRTE